MKLMMNLHFVYYVCLVAFILTIPHISTDANIFKLILFLLTLGVFILLCTFYIVLSFNKKFRAVRKYSYINVGCMCLGIVAFLTLGHVAYARTNSIAFLMAIFIVLFIASSVSNFKIKNILEDVQFDLIKEVKLFYNMGLALEKTPLYHAVTKLDYMFAAFCIAVFIAGNIYIFAGVVGIILILSIKYVRHIKKEFLKSGLISVKETYLSIVAYYFFYLISIVWAFFIPNLSILLVGAASLLAIKIYTRRNADKVYEEQNGSNK
jgi:hypothetical protein